MFEYNSEVDNAKIFLLTSDTTVFENEFPHEGKLAFEKQKNVMRIYLM